MGWVVRWILDLDVDVDVAWLSGMATQKKPGLWSNVQKKRKRIEQGSGELST
jgi:hypothetical protein